MRTEDENREESSEPSGDLPPGLEIMLEVLDGPDRGTKFRVTRSTTVLGRKDADLRLTDPTVSGKHALLEVIAGRLFLTDQKSTNGTKINGEPVESSPVVNGDELMLGDTRLRLSVTVDPERFDMRAEEVEGYSEEIGTSEEQTLVNQKLINLPLPDNLYVVLEVTDGPEKGKKFKVARRSTVIGRSRQADFRLQDPTVSLRHCQVEIHNKDKMMVKDLASSNGTRLNGHYISSVKIREGDLLQLGDSQIKILIQYRRGV